jgi:hypothetical protein
LAIKRSAFAVSCSNYPYYIHLRTYADFIVSNKVLCIFVLLVGRFVNAILPFTLGEVVKIFGEGSSRSPWPYLFAYVGLLFLQSGGGLGAIRDVMWFSS